MTEPLFFDCLTDAQFWSLFDTGVLQGYMLPVEVYERLVRIAPDHGCYLFTWPRGIDLPSVHDLVPDLAIPGAAPSAPPYSSPAETRATVERIRLALEAFCMGLHIDMPLEGGRIHVISTNPRPELRVGPYLQPQPRDLNAMSLPELEAYLDDVLWVDEGHEVDSGESSARR
jgi:hypothetical protein